MPSFANSTSVKEQVLAYFETLLAGITIANGYHVDIAEVHRFRAAPWEVAEHPALQIVGVREDKQAIEGQPPRMNTTLTMTIQALVASDPTDDTEELHNLLLLDIEAAAQVDVTCGGVAREVTCKSTELEVGFDDQPYAIPIITIEVQYQQGRADPSKSY